MSNSELTEYLKKSRQGRRELLDKAEEYIKPALNSNILIIPMNQNSEFPSPSPKRFAEFKEAVNNNLQIIFKPEKNKARKLPVLRSLSKEENYKKIYIGNKKKPHHSRKSSTQKEPTSFCENKIIFSLFPKPRYKESYLVPLLSKMQVKK